MNRHLGDLELPVLLIVQREHGEAYGWPIQLFLFLRFRRKLALGTICKTLHRLEAKGYVRSHWGPTRPEPGGKRRKLYSITPDGTQAIERTLQHRCSFGPCPSCKTAFSPISHPSTASSASSAAGE